ncbi:MAG: hypothetical protein ACE5D4_01940 [Thermodesulfobacteriota bacterium]
MTPPLVDNQHAGPFPLYAPIVGQIPRQLNTIGGILDLFSMDVVASRDRRTTTIGADGKEVAENRGLRIS